MGLRIGHHIAEKGEGQGVDGGTLDIQLQTDAVGWLHLGLDGEERGGVSKVTTTCVAGTYLLVRQFKVPCGTCLVFSSVNNHCGGGVRLETC